jgi:hypothetical protein
MRITLHYLPLFRSSNHFLALTNASSQGETSSFSHYAIFLNKFFNPVLSRGAIKNWTQTVKLNKKVAL